MPLEFSVKPACSYIDNARPFFSEPLIIVAAPERLW